MILGPSPITISHIVSIPCWLWPATASEPEQTEVASPQTSLPNALLVPDHAPDSNSKRSLKLGCIRIARRGIPVFPGEDTLRVNSTRNGVGASWTGEVGRDQFLRRGRSRRPRFPRRGGAEGGGGWGREARKISRSSSSSRSPTDSPRHRARRSGTWSRRISASWAPFR